MRLPAFRFLLFVGHDRAESRSHRRLRRDAILLRGTILRMALERYGDRSVTVTVHLIADFEPAPRQHGYAGQARV